MGVFPIGSIQGIAAPCTRSNIYDACDKAFREGKEVREEVDIYLDINPFNLSLHCLNR